ncbi:MAG: hypothetical protein O2V44_09040 [Candidatus Bathyarchaeota archaeon]|nr:hypothetical protein [Candidatus Bathyarchaeota archaeon]
MVSVQQLNLGLQVLVFIILSVGFFYLRKHRNVRGFSIHGYVMLGAVLLNLFSFLLVMGPAILGLRPFIMDRPTHVLAIITIVHASVGTVAEVMGGYFAFSWVLQACSIRRCVGKKRMMRLTFTLWSISFVSGLIEYAILYLL